MERWPATRAEMRQVADHWIRGCEADPFALLHEMQDGMTMTYDMCGFWVSDKMTHAAPASCAPAGGTAASFALPPSALVDLAVYLAFHDRAAFPRAVHLVEQRRHANKFWSLLHAEYIRRVRMHPDLDRVFSSVLHPGLRRFVWHAASVINGTCDVDAVAAKFRELMAHPMPVCTGAAHQGVVRLIETGALAVFENNRWPGALQYPEVCVHMSWVDHFLLCLLGVFGCNGGLEVPPPLREARAWLLDHRATRTPSVMQELTQ